MTLPLVFMSKRGHPSCGGLKAICVTSGSVATPLHCRFGILTQHHACRSDWHSGEVFFVLSHAMLATSLAFVVSFPGLHLYSTLKAVPVVRTIYLVPECRAHGSSVERNRYFLRVSRPVQSKIFLAYEAHSHLGRLMTCLINGQRWRRHMRCHPVAVG
ncbi:unnamed protein product [Ectocarpus sp. 12 AP-2014]